MPRIVFIAVFIGVALLPFLFFGAMRAASPGRSSGGYVSRGPSFFFVDVDRGPRQGRSFSSGGFQSGGARFGK